jgi:hypothetical protein
MGNKITYLLIIFAGIIEFITVRAWFVCNNFTDFFHLSSVNIKLQIEYYVHSEKGTSLFLTRLFNNKLIDSLFDILRVYLQFWDVRFGASWFSVIGYFGIGAGFYYIFSSKKKRFYHWLMLLVILFLPWIEVIAEPHVSIFIKSIYLWLPFCLFSLYGVYQFLIHGEKKRRISVFIILALISLWWIAFLPFGMSRYCVIK